MMQLISILSHNAAKHLGGTGLKFMQERGRMQTGMVADIVVFDPELFRYKSTYEKGTAPSTGMKSVIVNFPPEAKPRFEPISEEGGNNTFSTGMQNTFTGAFPEEGAK